jgi:hypothetical protein
VNFGENLVYRLSSVLRFAEFTLGLREKIVETKKRLRGRPKKTRDGIEPWQFARAAMVLCAYDEARRIGEKHSVAVREAVDYVRRCDSEMRISATEVKRVLATNRPPGSETILCFERSVRSDEAMRKNRWIREQLAALPKKKGITLPDVPNYDLSKSNLVLTIRVVPRPFYPRHNRKIPND